MYHSTRGNKTYTAKEALLKSIAPDNGLFVIDEIPSFKLEESDVRLSYKDLAKRILSLYLDDFSNLELDEAVSVYNNESFPYGLLKISGNTDYAFARLTYGPTFAYKDLALQILPKLIEIAKRGLNDNKKTVVLNATSGDGGSATLAGFSKNKDNGVIVLYPNNKTSLIQEQQMLSFKSDRVYPIAVNATFDEIRTVVKDIFQTYYKEQIDLISANSTNIGRIIAQIVYYYKSYLELVDKDYILFNEKINLVVPTGNFGNILAAIYAYKMGLPINKIVCATNENNVLAKFFETGVYDISQKFVQTNSPSMDIVSASNLERFLYLVYKDTSKINELYTELEKNHKFSIDLKDIANTCNILSGYSKDDDTVLNIQLSYKKNKNLIDPHTAVGFKVYNDLYDKLDNCFTLIISASSPYKFSSTVCKALSIDCNDDEKERIDRIYSYTGNKIDNRLYEFLFTKSWKTILELNEVKAKVIEILNKLSK